MVLILYNFPSVSLPFRAYVVPLWLLFPLCCLLLLPSGSFFLPSVLPLRGNETPFVPFRGVGSSLRPRSLPPLVRFAVPPLVLRLSPPGKEANQRGNVKDGARALPSVHRCKANRRGTTTKLLLFPLWGNKQLYPLWGYSSLT